MKRSLLFVAALATVASASGCASTSNQTKGAVIGAASGGTVGALIGSATGSTATGLVLGTMVGGAGGAIIGHQMDQQAKEIQHDVQGANVARVGEGMDVTFASSLLFDANSDVLTARNLCTSFLKKVANKICRAGHSASENLEEFFKVIKS